MCVEEGERVRGGEKGRGGGSGEQTDPEKCVNKATPTPGMRRYPSDFLDQSQGTVASFDKNPKLSLGRCNHVTSSTV